MAGTSAAWSDFALVTPPQGQSAPQAGSGSGSGWDQFALVASPRGQTQKATLADMMTAPPEPAQASPAPRGGAHPGNPFNQFDPGENPFNRFDGQAPSTLKDLMQAGQAYWSDLSAPFNNAVQSLQRDAAASWNPSAPKTFAEKYIPGFSPGQQAMVRTVGDVGAIIASPITGLLNAEVVQPGASLLDLLPAPQRLSLDANGKVQATALTLAEQHAQNEQIISNALMSIGPEGMEGGGAVKFAKAKNASNLASVVTKVPAEVALDASGKLTDEGLEYAAKANVQPKELEAAYKAVQDAKPAPPKPETPAAQPVPAQSAPAAPADARAPAEATPAVPQQPSAIWRNANEDHPVEVAGEPQTGPDGKSYTPVKSQVHGGLGFVPTEELAPVAGATDTAAANGVRVGPNGLTDFGERPQDVPTTAAGRAAEAQQLGVKLTEGQATRDFSTQDAEERLRAGEAPQSNAARQFKEAQQNDIANAVDTLKQAIGDPTLTSEDRGQMVQDALRQMNQSGQAGASALYDQARKLAEALGSHGSNLMKLDTGDLAATIKHILMDETVDPQARAALRQQAAQYGLIGGEPRIFEDGTAAVKVLDQEGKEGPAITLPRAPEPLTIQNAEGFRQAANRIYRQFDEPRALELKGVIDKAVGDAIDRAATSDAGEFGKVMQQARAAYRANRETFGAKDVVQSLIDWKVEGKTPVISPDKAVEKLFQGGKDSITALKKVKAVLLSKPTEQSLAAWDAIKSQALENIFGQARVVNANGGVGGLSGAKLNSAIQKFGVDKLKILLNESEFNQLMQLRRVVANATIQADHIANASNSGNVLARFAMKHGNSVVGKGLRSIPGVGHALEAARDAAEIAGKHAEDQRTLNGILNYRVPPGS